MALRERVPQAGPAWQECGVAWLLRTLDHDDAATLRDWLDSDVNIAWIVEQIREETGLRAEGNALRRHRRGDCKC